MENQLNLSPKELQDLQQDLMANIYNQVGMQLLILQRSRRLNASNCVPVVNRSAAAKITNRKLSLCTRKFIAKFEDETAQNMPNEEILNEIKLQKELDILLSIYKRAYEQVVSSTASKSCHEELIAVIELQLEDGNKEQALLQELKQNQLTLKSLKDTIDETREQTEKRMQQQNDQLSTLRHNLRNVRRVNDLEYSLVVRWEQNRLTQATIVCGKAECALERKIADLQGRLDGEQRIICDVENFNKQQFDEYQMSIMDWERKYAMEMAKMHVQTQQKEKEIRDLRKMHEKRRETYEQRVQFVHEYLSQKAEEQRLYEQQMHRIDCAIRIQAWWRGVMVRRGLGPYKKKTKKGKKSKAKGK